MSLYLYLPLLASHIWLHCKQHSDRQKSYKVHNVIRKTKSKQTIYYQHVQTNIKINTVNKRFFCRRHLNRLFNTLKKNRHADKNACERISVYRTNTTTDFTPVLPLLCTTEQK